MNPAIAVRAHPALHHSPPPPPLRLIPESDPGDRQLALPLRSVTTAGHHVAPELVDRASGFVRALVEAVEGARPVLQLAPWVSDDVYDQILRRRALRLPRAHAFGRSRVATVRVSVPAEDAAEVAARLETGRRSRALALRLDRRPDCRSRLRWKCTALTWG